MTRENPPRISGLRHILFDAVGTLIYPDPPVAEVYAAAGARYGSCITQDLIRERFPAALLHAEQGGSMTHPDTLERPATSQSLEYARWQSIVRAIFDDVSSAAAEQLFAELWQHFSQPRHWTLYADVAPAWQALAVCGLSLGIASNFDARLASVCRGLPPLDQARLFVSAEVGYPKPSPRFFAAVANQLQAAPHEILLVGDDLVRDIHGARQAGWHVLQIDRHATASGEGVIRDLREVTARLA